MTKAIILLSGGLDSTVMLALALSEGRSCYALSFHYNQRHAQELDQAKLLVAHYQVPHLILKVETPAFATSELLNKGAVPIGRTLKEIESGAIPSTYVPGRNLIFLAYAAAQAELVHADEIWFGCNASDAKPYVDCRPAFLDSFQAMLNLATKQAVEGHPPKLVTPLIQMDKRAIIQKGIALKVPLELTWSCYSPTIEGKPCQQCDACRIRNEGFLKKTKRRFGILKGKIKVAKDFDAPLPEELLTDFDE